MLKKLSTLGLVLLLTFYPAAAFAETIDAVDQDDKTVTNEDNTEATAGASSDESTEEESDTEGTEPPEKESPESDEELGTQQVGSEETEQPEENNSEVEETNDEVETDVEETEESETENPNVAEKATTMAVTSSDENVEDVSVQDAEEQEEEELNLNDVFGTANGDITFDFNKGYYVLDLRASITNFHTNQEIKDKWLAFTLPNGVYMLDEDVPNGVVKIGIAGKSGLAIKMPDVQSSSSGRVNLDIPLSGVDNDNDPHVNTYLLDVDVESNSFTEIGQLRGENEIDFSVMEETPTLDLSGSITGNTEYDEENKYHFLNVTVNALNASYDNVNDLYVGFELPEDVMVISDENTPADMEIVRTGDGIQEVALKLPELSEGAEEEITYNIPVVGVSDSVVESDTITAFRIYDSTFDVIGEFDGQINVDFSNMDLEWHFNALGEIISDYPGTRDGEVGFRFNYEVGNLDLDDVEGVEIEFDVPEGINILEPDYFGGTGVDVEWDGNTATVLIGDLSGAGGYEGYFTAIGETNLSIDQLRELEVTITLFRDGDTVVETLQVPFELGQYDEDDLEEPSEPTDPEPGDQKPGDGDTDPSDGDKNPGEDHGDNSKDTDDGNVNPGNNNNDNNNTGSNKDDDNGATSGSAGSSDDNGKGETLPDTATNTYTMLVIGALLVIAGGSFMFIRKKNSSVTI